MATANLSPASVLQGFAALPGSSKIGLLLASAALIALVSGSWMWSQTPEYRVLYANVSDRDGASIVAALGQLNVPYKFSEGGGAILVPEQMVHEARLKLASQGLPRGGNVGFELMESQKFGTTQFQEQVNYQRGLEGELSRTIQTLSAVASARVHLAIPKPTVFMREAPKPSASVVVNLHPGRSLERAQIAGIMHLVSASVPNLDSGAVSVIDQHGVLLSARGTSAPGGLDAEQIGYVSRMESDYRKRIEDLLEPVVGRSNVRAQVNVEVDFTQSESLAESYRPNQAEPAVRSQQTSEANAGASGGAAQGVPGALSNQPPPAPTAPIAGGTGAVAGAAPAATQQAQSAVRRDSTVNYEVDKTVRHVRTSTGAIRRLSAAVVVNYRKPAAAEAAKGEPKKGKGAKDAPPPRPTALGQEEMQQITALVKEAIGFSQQRGDSLSVSNVPFSADPPEVAPEPSFWNEPGTIAFAKETGRNLLIAGLALYLFLGVLRPLLRQLAQARPALPQEPSVPPQLAGPGGRYEDNLQALRQIARDDPRRVAGVLRTWVKEEAGADG